MSKVADDGGTLPPEPPPVQRLTSADKPVSGKSAVFAYIPIEISKCKIFDVKKICFKMTKWQFNVYSSY